MAELALNTNGSYPEPIHKHYRPGPIALAAHRSKAQVKLAWGPLGTAKTTWLCSRAYTICERAAQAGYSARILFLRDTYRNLIDSTFVTWKELFVPDSADGYIAQSDPFDFKLNVGGRGQEFHLRSTAFDIADLVSIHSVARFAALGCLRKMSLTTIGIRTPHPRRPPDAEVWGPLPASTRVRLQTHFQHS